MIRSPKERELLALAQEHGYVTPLMAEQIYASGVARRGALQHLCRAGFVRLEPGGVPRFVWTGKTEEEL
jgi:hypothetical protein